MWTSNQLCYYFLRMKTCGNIPSLLIYVYSVAQQKMEFTVIRLNAFENCLSLYIFLFYFMFFSLILPNNNNNNYPHLIQLRIERKRKSSNLNSTIMQKLELCPKIKLNKSLHRAESFVSFFFTTIGSFVLLFRCCCRCRVIYIQKEAKLTLAACLKRIQEKYFHDFPHRWCCSHSRLDSIFFPYKISRKTTKTKYKERWEEN
jgi:hypothetical protein